MMYVIAGATGRVGGAAARQLIERGADVRVLVRNPAAAEEWEAAGADARIVQLADRQTLGEAIEGAAGMFVLLPFDLDADDLDAYADELIASIAGAIADRRVPHVVMLSSIGADRAEGTGPITGLHRMERALRATGTTLTAMRSGHFQEKVADVFDAARQGGVYPVFAASPEATVPMGATRDLGATVAELLLSPPETSEAVDVIGPDYSEREVARVLGEALGRELQVVALPESEWADALTEAGFRPHIARSLAELYAADDRGLLEPRGDRLVRVRTPLETTIAGLLER